MGKTVAWYSIIAAMIIVFLFLGLSWYMLHDVAATDPTVQYRWERALSIYNGLQALAAAAAGVLLGTTVQQSNVKAAEARADAAQTGAQKANAAKQVLNSQPPPGGAALSNDQKVNAVLSILN